MGCYRARRGWAEPPVISATGRGDQVQTGRIPPLIMVLKEIGVLNIVSLPWDL